MRKAAVIVLGVAVAAATFPGTVAGLCIIFAGRGRAVDHAAVIRAIRETPDG